MFKIQEINQEKCIKCGECIRECVSRLLIDINAEDTEKNMEVHYLDPFNACSACGHCIAVCSENAIEYSEGDECFEGEIIKNPETVSYETIMEIVRSRRSIRQYKQKEVPQAEIQAVLEAMRYAPSASNEQNWEYIVLRDEKLIQTYAQKVLKMIKLTYKLVSNKIINTLFLWGPNRKLAHDPSFLYSMRNLIEKQNQGKDPIFFNAPCVIILHSPSYGNMAGNDAGIAITHGMLAAQTRGLGTCWIGIAQETTQRVKSISNWLQIPKGRKIWGIFTLGYPKVHFKRAPPRNDLKIIWR